MTRSGEETLQLSLTAEQGNLAIAALAECPFKLVYELIGKLNGQANAAAQSGQTYACTVGAAELKLMLDALGKLPYERVHALIHELQRQLQMQLQTRMRSGKPPKADGKTGKR